MPDRDEGEVTFDFIGGSSAVVNDITPCCDKPTYQLGEMHERPADDPEPDDERWITDEQRVVGGLLTRRGGRSWWLMCSNCATDIVGIVWDPPAKNSPDTSSASDTPPNVHLGADSTTS